MTVKHMEDMMLDQSSIDIFFYFVLIMCLIESVKYNFISIKIQVFYLTKPTQVLWLNKCKCSACTRHLISFCLDKR